jgi:superfamily I DNA/RNA helicase
MSDAPTPNDQQQELITSTEGTYLVDAGPGTGKTFAITRRYATIIDQPDVEPTDVLLATFTRNAATETIERIVDHADYGMRDLADAPIQTFHSYCHDLLQEHGYDAPAHLGLDGHITGSTRHIEEELLETTLFEEFIGQFRDQHPEYTDQFRALSDPTELLDIINELAATGVFPTVDGWYRDGRAALEGNFELFEGQFDAVNARPEEGNRQSPLRDAVSDFGKNKTYRPDAPSRTELRGSRGTKQLADSVAREVFGSDRDALIDFVHAVYVEYLRFALSRNYLTFGFLQLFAFILLCEDAQVRERVQFEYVMVDEFQDTSEIQFKLALLLAGTDNVCVVGDWKQSIYSFQYADVQNILAFEERLERFVADLNSNADRVTFKSPIQRIELTENYRSTQALLEFSEEALVTPAKSSEAVDDDTLADVVSLSSNATVAETTIQGCHHEDEHEAVLSTIQDLIGKGDYLVEDEDGEPRPPTYEDIAVFTRTRNYGRELLEAAHDAAVPMAYEGGVELFRTDPAKLLLAWLRILDRNANRGWAVILEEAGYTLDEIDHILETETYPDAMVGFKETLAASASVGAVARRVFDRYGCGGAYADVLLHTIQQMHDTTTVTRGEVIQLIERGIESASTHEVHTSAGEDSVTVQTIHAAKGLEYPIVIMANMNDGAFPPRTQDQNVLRFDEATGLRQRKVYADVPEHAHPHVYDNWRYDVIRQCLPDDLDEERRLLYVAITRAENHVIFAGGEEPNHFLEALPVDVTVHEPTLEDGPAAATEQAGLPFAVSAPDGPIGHTPHSLMDDSVFEDSAAKQEASPEPHPAGDETPETRGLDFGNQVHDFAEAYALGDAVSPSNDHERRVAQLIDSCDGELHVEEPARLPIEVDGQQVTISGVVDLVHVTDDRVEIIDYKTDSTRQAEEQYRMQVSVYYHVLSAMFDGREVTAELFYTADGERVSVSPLSREELQTVIRQTERNLDANESM